MPEKRHDLAQERVRLSHRLALLELAHFEREGEVVASQLPDHLGLEAEKLRGAMRDASNLREALLEVSEDEFPQVEQGYRSVSSHWKGLLVKAKAALEEQCTDEDACRA